MSNGDEFVIEMQNGEQEFFAERIVYYLFNLSNMDAMDTQLPFTEEMPLFMRLEKIASYSALSRKQQIDYDDSYNNYLAYQGEIAFNLHKGEKIGFIKGEKKGRAEGERNALLATARNMKSEGLSIDLIAKITCLTPEEIASL